MKTNYRDNYLVKYIAIRYPTSSCKNIHAALLQNGTNASAMTVSRRLRFEIGVESFKPVLKSRLTADMKSKHLRCNMKPRELNED